MSLATVAVALGDETLAALDRYIEKQAPGRSRADLVAEIVTKWAARQAGPPDEGMRPEELNASNDS
ncbi:hypothetical protein [Bosea sp. NBC_00550]|uniref:hypothetical protein n=1 Tax=Bosea sp. NBC_00550 TaxID=2969621 RepID=UPI00222E31EC|nr:hypothetical protein [Bosea sp. NBC_00550]UZF93546.1 hypothetical protein NWE53_04925 [Bosea sp. NBC_00550]